MGCVGVVMVWGSGGVVWEAECYGWLGGGAGQGWSGAVRAGQWELPRLALYDTASHTCQLPRTHLPATPHTTHAPTCHSPQPHSVHQHVVLSRPHQQAHAARLRRASRSRVHTPSLHHHRRRMGTYRPRRPHRVTRPSTLPTPPSPAPFPRCSDSFPQRKKKVRAVSRELVCSDFILEAG